LKWIISALGRQADENDQHLFIKFDSWSVLELPRLRRVYPGVPCIFLYRDPFEVLASHFAQRGAQMVPGVIEPELFGMTLSEVSEIEPEEYCARVLASVCEAALRQIKDYGGMLINYTQLPEAVQTHVLGFFGVEVSISEVEAMERMARNDSRNPMAALEERTQRIPPRTAEALRAEVAKWVSPLYEQLEAARLGA
jgi:hypothetical protein